MERAIHRNRTYSCPVPYIPDARRAEENAARDAETLQDRAALEFALKIEQRKKNLSRSLRSSTTAVPDHIKLSRPKKPVKSSNNNKKFDLSLDFSGLSTYDNENKDSVHARNATMSARDYLHKRQKLAVLEKVKSGDEKVTRTRSACV